MNVTIATYPLLTKLPVNETASLNLHQCKSKFLHWLNLHQKFLKCCNQCLEYAIAVHWMAMVLLHDSKVLGHQHCKKTLQHHFFEQLFVMVLLSYLQHKFKEIIGYLKRRNKGSIILSNLYYFSKYNNI